MKINIDYLQKFYLLWSDMKLISFYHFLIWKIMQNREVSAQNSLMGFLNNCMLDRCDSTRKNEDFIKKLYIIWSITLFIIWNIFINKNPKERSQTSFCSNNTHSGHCSRQLTGYRLCPLKDLRWRIWGSWWHSATLWASQMILFSCTKRIKCQETLRFNMHIFLATYCP